MKKEGSLFFHLFIFIPASCEDSKADSYEAEQLLSSLKLSFRFTGSLWEPTSIGKNIFSAFEP